jgi:aspartate aminotransferase
VPAPPNYRASSCTQVVPGDGDVITRSERIEQLRGWTRSGAIPVSSLHEIHRIVERRRGDTIALHVGEPHIRMPDAALEAYVRALRAGHTAYNDVQGLRPLREALAAHLVNNGAPSPEQIFVTPGSSQAIAAVLQAMAVEQAVALLPAIHWPIHLQQVLMVGMRPRFYRIEGPDVSPVAALEAAYDPNVTVIVVNSPANPTGLVLSQRVLGEIHEWAVRRRVSVISDEAYEDFAFEGEVPTMAAFDAALPEKDRVVFSVHTFSKGFSMTGCRLGYMTSPSRERTQNLCRVQEATLVAPSTPVQYAGLAALAERDHLDLHHAYVRDTRDAVMAAIEPLRLLWVRPAGGWYALLDLSEFTPDSNAFCHDLLGQTGIALAPGAGFVPAGHPLSSRIVRVALCGDREITLRGIDGLLAYLRHVP